MAYYNSIITELGAALLTDVLSNGGEVKIVAAAVGTGTPSGDPYTMTALVSPAEASGIILHDKYISQGAPTTLIMPLDVSNLGLSAELPIREIGIYAQGETGQILFAYSWYEGEDGANVLPVPKDPTTADAVHTFEVGVFVTNQQAAAISVTVSDAAYLTAEQKGEPYGVAEIDANGMLALKHRSYLLTNEDLNDIVADGYYRARTTHECLNVPNDVTAFGLLVLRIGENMTTGGNCNQILVPYGSAGNIIYTRIATEGVWDIWRRIALADSVVSKSGDKMTGDLYLNDLVRLVGNENAFIPIAYNAAKTTERQFLVNNTDYQPNLYNALLLKTKDENGGSNLYRLYGEHYSPAVVATASLVE